MIFVNASPKYGEGFFLFFIFFGVTKEYFDLAHQIPAKDFQVPSMHKYIGIWSKKETDFSYCFGRCENLFSGLFCVSSTLIFMWKPGI